jgi:hypothetical protein
MKKTFAILAVLLCVASVQAQPYYRTAAEAEAARRAQVARDRRETELIKLRNLPEFKRNTNWLAANKIAIQQERLIAAYKEEMRTLRIAIVNKDGKDASAETARLATLSNNIATISSNRTVYLAKMKAIEDAYKK